PFRCTRPGGQVPCRKGRRERPWPLLACLPEGDSTMRQRLFGASLLALFVLAMALVGSALSAPKDKKKKKAEEPPIDSGKLNAGVFTGKLESVPGSDRLFLVGVEEKKLEATGKKGARNGTVDSILRLQAQIQTHTARLATSRNPAAELRHIQSLQL